MYGVLIITYDVPDRKCSFMFLALIQERRDKSLTAVRLGVNHILLAAVLFLQPSVTFTAHAEICFAISFTLCDLTYNISDHSTPPPAQKCHQRKSDLGTT